ncbi:MAG: hypothetical protein U1F51_01300 [Burkholderiales bacterium]
MGPRVGDVDAPRPRVADDPGRTREDVLAEAAERPPVVDRQTEHFPAVGVGDQELAVPSGGDRDRRAEALAGRRLLPDRELARRSVEHEHRLAAHVGDVDAAGGVGVSALRALEHVLRHRLLGEPGDDRQDLAGERGGIRTVGVDEVRLAGQFADVAVAWHFARLDRRPHPAVVDRIDAAVDHRQPGGRAAAEHDGDERDRRAAPRATPGGCDRRRPHRGRAPSGVASSSCTRALPPSAT